MNQSNRGRQAPRQTKAPRQEAGLVAKLRQRGHICNLQGRDFVLYAGLLELAHEAGLETILTEIVHIDHEKGWCVVKATVAGARGTYTGHGDASPANVSRGLASAYVRMAETRAKARCLRDFLGIGMTAREELPPQL